MFQQEYGLCGYNPFITGSYNPRMNFFLGMAETTAGIMPPYIPFIQLCPGSVFTPLNITYPNLNTLNDTGSFNYQYPASFNYQFPSTISYNTTPLYNFTYTNPITSVTNSNTKASKSDNNDDLSKIRDSKLMTRVPQGTKNEILSSVDEACKKYNVDPKLVISMMKCESEFDPNATSKCGAAGLMQLMPATAKSYGASNPYNIKENIFAAVKFIKYLQDKYNGNRDLIIAAYNAGPGRVTTRVPDIKETKNYVAKVNQTYSSLA